MKRKALSSRSQATEEKKAITTLRLRAFPIKHSKLLDNSDMHSMHVPLSSDLYYYIYVQQDD